MAVFHDSVRLCETGDAVQCAGSLSDDDVYAVVAYILSEAKIIKATDTMDAMTLPKVTMPNRDGFIPDSRPESNCIARAKCFSFLSSHSLNFQSLTLSTPLCPPIICIGSPLPSSPHSSYLGS